MRRQASRPQGFTLIEAAVAVGVIAIIAGAAAPLVMKALNQQREQRARSEMKLIYYSLFGTTDSSTPCMRSDFGYVPALNTLGWLVGQPSSVRTYSAYPPPNAMLSGGWRGPYWSGRINAAGLPVDPWGHPYVLRDVGTQGWQVLCVGSNAVNDTLGNTVIQKDDLAYPVPAVAFKNGTLYVNVNAAAAGSPPAAVVVALTPDYQGVKTISPSTSAAPLHTFTSSIPPGQVLVKVTVPLKPDQYQSVYMPSGATQTLTFYF